jgi:hypothetical protein
MHLNNLLHEMQPSSGVRNLDTTSSANGPTPPQSREASSVNLKLGMTTVVKELALERAQEDMELQSTGHRHDRTTVSNEPTPPHTRVPSPAPTARSQHHMQLVLGSWEKMVALQEGSKVVLDGESLDIPSVVAVAK